MKTIVTHISPDTDAITSVWLIHRFFPQWGEAAVSFVPAGETLNNQPADSDPNIIHVDTGMGQFDHHQSNENTCAAQKVFVYLKKTQTLKKNQRSALERMVDFVNDTDHFREVFLPDADSDRYDFSLPCILDGLRVTFNNDNKLLSTGEALLDAIFNVFCNKIRAEKEIVSGLTFESKWGKTLALLTDNEEASRLAQKKGYAMVIRKSPEKGHLRIKTIPLPKLNLKKLYTVLKKKDRHATWFFHASGHMILNGSVKNPKSVPTVITLNQAVDLVKQIS